MPSDGVKPHAYVYALEYYCQLGPVRPCKRTNDEESARVYIYIFKCRSCESERYDFNKHQIRFSHL